MCAATAPSGQTSKRAAWAGKVKRFTCHWIHPLKMPTPPEQKSFGNSGIPELLPPRHLSLDNSVEPNLGDPSTDALTNYVSDSILRNLPNDLTRMIYLASLRDCNSGLYLHPELSNQRGLQASDLAFRSCHQQVFRRLLNTRMPEYVQQLHEYIRYTRAEAATILTTWRSLQAYRATIPVGAGATSAAQYFLNLSIALEIVSQQMSESKSA